MKWEPFIPGSPKFSTELERDSTFQQQFLASKLRQDPNLVNEILKTPLGELLDEENLRQLNPAPAHTLFSETKKIIIGITDKSTPALEQEKDYVSTVFFLCATLHKYPFLIEPLTEKLKPIDKSEEILKNRQLRAFIMQILFLSHYPQFDVALKNLNPQKFTPNKKTYSQIKHPLDEIELSPNSYVHFLACQQWYTVTQEKRYQALIDRLKTTVTKPQQICTIEDALNQMVEEAALGKILLKTFLAQKINDSKILLSDS